MRQQTVEKLNAFWRAYKQVTMWSLQGAVAAVCIVGVILGVGQLWSSGWRALAVLAAVAAIAGALALAAWGRVRGERP